MDISSAPSVRLSRYTSWPLVRQRYLARIDTKSADILAGTAAIVNAYKGEIEEVATRLMSLKRICRNKCLMAALARVRETPVDHLPRVPQSHIDELAAMIASVPGIDEPIMQVAPMRRASPMIGVAKLKRPFHKFETPREVHYDCVLAELQVCGFADEKTTTPVKNGRLPWEHIVTLHKARSFRLGKSGFMLGGYAINGTRSNDNVPFRSLI